jgi:hypothetical protein
MKSNVSGIHLCGCWVSKRLSQLPDITQHIVYWGYLLSHPTATGYITSGSNITLWTLKHLSSNVHISLHHLHNCFCTFQNLPRILPAEKHEATQFHYNYQKQHVSQTAKTIKIISEGISRRTQLMAMHNTTQMVSHLVRHTNRIPSSNADPLSGSSDTEVMVPQKTWRRTW